MSLLYDNAKELVLSALVNLTGDTVNVALIEDGLYTPDGVNHATLSDIPAGAIIATQTLANKTNTDGAYSADDLVFTGITSGTVGGLLVYKYIGDGSDPLIAYIDSGTGFPLTANGSDIVVSWSTIYGVFKL